MCRLEDLAVGACSTSVASCSTSLGALSTASGLTTAATSACPLPASDSLTIPSTLPLATSPGREVSLDQPRPPAMAKEQAAKGLRCVRGVHDLPQSTPAQSSSVAWLARRLLRSR